MKVVSFENVKFEDIELIRNWRNSKEVAQYMYTDGIISNEEQVNWFSKISNSSNSKYWIINFDDTKIGLVNITNIDFPKASCSWAFYIGETRYRESGAAVQTEFNLIEKAFFELNLKIINCEVISTNIQVLNLHKRFGFKMVLKKESFIIKNGISVSIVKFVLYKNDWELIRDNLKKIIFNNIQN
jgi:UDP-4-amino-4,6-dideoxy-N-acetyl-beta-L-altrosamine N-acetyltransferase